MRISTGLVLGGPEMVESAVCSAIKKKGLLMQSRCPLYCEDVTEAGLNIVFYTPGSLFQPDWEGVRTGRFSRKQKLLMIQAAVPEEMVSSKNIGPFLCEMMRQGVVEAKPVFEKAKIPFDAEAFTKFIDDIEVELGWRKAKD